MKLYLLLFVWIFFGLFSKLQAQSNVKPEYKEYVDRYKSLAVREMRMYKIPASITLAQGIIESNCGKSVLSVESKNHFGIKCQKEWMGEKYFYDDDEANECFRKYSSVDESYRDHSLFLTTRSRYAFLFNLPLKDYKAWAKGLKQAGYATNPEYANILIKVIEESELFLLDDTIGQNPKELSEKINPEKENEPSENGLFYSTGRVLYFENYMNQNPSDFKFLYTSDLGRKVYENFGVAFVFANAGDTWAALASEFKLYSFQIFKQNDMLQSDKIIPDQIVYLEPKKKKQKIDNYTVKKGDSMYSISQQFCIRLKYLYQYNGLQPGDEPRGGAIIKLHPSK